MGNWSCRYENEKKYVVFQEDSIIKEFNSVAFGMLMNNSISCLVPCSVSQTDNKRCVFFNVSSLQSFNDYFKNETTFEFVSDLFLDICTSVIKLRRYMIEPNDIVLDYDKMYITSSAEVKFLINPLWRESNTPDCKAVFRNIIVNLKLNNRDSQHIGAMLALLNKKDFSIDNFFEDMKKMNDPRNADSGRFDSQLNGGLSVYSLEHITAGTEGRALKNNQVKHAADIKESAESSADSYDKNEKNPKSGLWIGKLFSRKKQGVAERVSAMDGLAVPGQDNIGIGRSSVSESDATVIESNDDATDILTEGGKYPKLFNRSAGTAVSIDRDIFRIGRDPSLGLEYIISSKQVSHHHATIKFKKNSYYIVDENSTNHIYVNGKKIQAGCDFRLNSGDTIRIGSEEFVFEK